tara:strand:+ start:133 stop:357 length:225 start_codon:yes stop_codon:yes gene_type:complete
MPDAIEIEVAVNTNNRIICSGSFIAVLGRMINGAPTRPNDNTRLNFITKTIIKMETVNAVARLENSCLFENVFE